eukprot:1275528-Prymnesium_polylepis.1
MFVSPARRAERACSCPEGGGSTRVQRESEGRPPRQRATRSEPRAVSDYSPPRSDRSRFHRLSGPRGGLGGIEKNNARRSHVLLS